MGSRYQCWGKRTLDTLASSAALLLLAPLLAGVGVLVLVKLGRPIFFRQVRPGLRGRPFELVKFRTMREGGGADSERLTALGNWLRNTSVDELPELLNVLRGEMSLVGPRPLLMQYLGRYTPRQARRHEVRPGITGWAQVRGRNALSWEEKFELDVWYVDHWSLGLDLRILWRTVRQVLRREGISHQGAATMPEFMGSGNEVSREVPAE